MDRVLLAVGKNHGNSYKVAKYLKNCYDFIDLYIIEDSRIDFSIYKHIVLFSGVYADKVHARLSDWLSKDHYFHNDVVFHVFLTWFGRGKSNDHAYVQVEGLLNSRGYSCDIHYGSCLGEWFFIRKGHPDNNDFINTHFWFDTYVKE